MTPSPHSINSVQTLAKALEFMRQYRVKHLPVLEGGQLVGVLTERDIQLVESLKGVDLEKVLVEDAYTPEPYTLPPNSPLDEALTVMAEMHYSCILVVDSSKLVGIFTWIDALAACAKLLKSDVKSS
ncbi:MAG: CBS domain-containing protein [Bdellovibrionales bacterium CG10_big_fil_rev_8_21_14_0_10_45_34]|nr:MAG: CBS domain-containing protein [Bdellovibrionales bacterium CG10_big_fil_rev_8_21_14_0_10_45_34]